MPKVMTLPRHSSIRFSPSTSVSPANLYSTNFSTIIITYHPGLVQ
jgi:hypothetical protein